MAYVLLIHSAGSEINFFDMAQTGDPIKANFQSPNSKFWPPKVSSTPLKRKKHGGKAAGCHWF